MSIRKQILFVINPISGGKSKSSFKKLVLEALDLRKFTPTFEETLHANHAFELAKAAVAERFDAVIAVGGDGTINEIASALVGTDVPLGIIPEGSGNGLALYLGIPMNEGAAIRRLNQFQNTVVDCGQINGRYFFNMAGMGFDAEVSETFAQDTFRGPIGYLRSAISVLKNYKPAHYTINIDGNIIERNAFMISVANSPQYGNNAYIAPQASLTYGVLDVCIVHKFPMYILPKMIFHLFNKSADQSTYVEILPGKNISIHKDDDTPMHVDGEPFRLGKDVEIEIIPKSLKIIC